MLNEKKISISGKSVVNDVEIASFGAVIDVATDDVSFFNRQLDKPACKLNREIVRADQAEFEDFVYAVQEAVKPATTEGV